MTKKLTIGIIGVGRIGKLHTLNILRHFPQVKLKTLADPYIDREWANENEIAHVTTEYQTVLADPEIDAVFICTPSTTHAALIKETARAGKNIFCEKPIALDPEIIKDVVSTAEAAGVKLQVGFNRRFDPNFSKLRHMLSTNKVGRPYLIRITSRDPEPPPLDYVKQSGGLFLDMTIHDFDMARFLANSEVEEVFAMGAALINPDIAQYDDVDTAITTLKFKNGLYAIIDNSRKATYGYDQRVEVFGSEGNLAAENPTKTNIVLSTEDSVSIDKPFHFFTDRYIQAYVEEIGAFFKCVMEDTEPLVTGNDGLMAVLIGLAAKESCVERRAVTTLCQ